MLWMVLALVSSFFVACGGPWQPGDAGQEGTQSASTQEYTDALISSKSLAMTVPTDQDAAQQASSTNTGNAGFAEFYLLTYKTARNINRGLRDHLNLLEDIVAHPPTARHQNKRLWGPWTPALSPVTYLFAIEKTGPGTFNYLLRGKAKGTPDQEYRKLFEGRIARGTRPHRGAGIARFYFDHVRSIDPAQNQRGTTEVQFDNRNETKIQVTQRGVNNAHGGTADAIYQYEQKRDGSGTFRFRFLADIDQGNTKRSAKEHGLVISRWLTGGAGRADVTLTGGDLGQTQVRFQECWNAQFTRTFYVDNKNLKPLHGSPTHCALPSTIAP